MAEREPDDEWIEKVVKLGSAFGMNPMRTRWKLIRWQERRRKAARRREQQVDHVRYQHKTCDTCGAVQDRHETTCSRCEAKLGRRGVQVLRRIGVGVPEALSISTLLALALIGVYVRVLAAAGGGLGSPPVDLLFQFGGHWPAAVADEPWRLVTAMFLHAGLWHLAFNLLAIAMIGPRIESLYGRMTMLCLFVATGTLAGVGSGAIGLDGVGVGASGGVMGLIGVAAGYGHRQGTWVGRTLRNDMLKWSAYTLLFGFFINADNWAHAFGGVTGAIFGYLVRPERWKVPALVPLRAFVELAGAVAAVGALVIIFTRTPSAADRFAEPRPTYEPYAKICRLHFAGDRVAARGAFDALEKRPSALVAEDSAAGRQWRRSKEASEIFPGDDPVAVMCENLLVTRQWCRDGRFDDRGSGASASPLPELCATIESAFGDFAEQPRSE